MPQPPSPALLRWRSGAVQVSVLTDVALDVLPELATPALRLALLDREDADPVLSLEEAERSLHVGLGDLAAQMTRSHVPPTADGIGAALRAWVDCRPVTDAAAAHAGVAVLDWTDGTQTDVGWSVVVCRGRSVLTWHPSPAVDARGLYRARSAALGRSFTVPAALSIDGCVAVWSHERVPLLVTAALVDPGQLRREAGLAGLDVQDGLVVISPGRPVAAADASVARRLAGESAEPAVLLPWRALPDLDWVPTPARPTTD